MEAEMVDAYRRHDNDKLLELMDRWRRMGGTHKRARTLIAEVIPEVGPAEFDERMGELDDLEAAPC